MPFSTNEFRDFFLEQRTNTNDECTLVIGYDSNNERAKVLWDLYSFQQHTTWEPKSNISDELIEKYLENIDKKDDPDWVPGT